MSKKLYSFLDKLYKEFDIMHIYFITILLFFLGLLLGIGLLVLGICALRKSLQLLDNTKYGNNYTCYDGIILQSGKYNGKKMSEVKLNTGYTFWVNNYKWPAKTNVIVYVNNLDNSDVKLALKMQDKFFGIRQLMGSIIVLMLSSSLIIGSLISIITYILKILSMVV